MSLLLWLPRPPSQPRMKPRSRSRAEEPNTTLLRWSLTLWSLTFTPPPPQTRLARSFSSQVKEPSKQSFVSPLRSPQDRLRDNTSQHAARGTPTCWTPRPRRSGRRPRSPHRQRQSRDGEQSPKRMTGPQVAESSAGLVECASVHPERRTPPARLCGSLCGNEKNSYEPKGP